MRIVRYASDRKTRYGILDSEVVREIIGTPYRHLDTNGHSRKLSEVRLLAPCTPSKIVALGVNYRRHSQEVNVEVPTEPLIFLKPSTAVIGPEGNIVYPESSRQVDYEGELAVVIKKRTFCVPAECAGDCILGYTCFNDVTARDLQTRDKQWTRSKSFDTFAAIGPWIETELEPDNVGLETYLNGELRQRSTTRELIFKVRDVVSFVSHVMTLLPGDVIATGTPNGIGPMKPGDTVQVKIESIGVLRNYVVRSECRRLSPR